jgi:S-adenosylmethionine decarboxylase
MGEFVSVAIRAIAKSEKLTDTTTVTNLKSVPNMPSASRAEYSVGGPETEPKDHFILRDGVECAGVHLILDLYGARHLDDLNRMEQAFRDAVVRAGATLLHIHLHHFTPNGGISGVAVLAESHISVHTWPERNYAAFDVFMCGSAKPELAIEVFKQAFEPERAQVCEYLRGVVDAAPIPAADRR